MRIQDTIKAYGLTQDIVAHRMGISRVTLTRNINGNPTLETMEKIAKAIGCSVGEFFDDERAPQEEPKSSLLCPHCGKELHITIE